ncbi:hypothetical protein [Herbaspirillum rhizosphaerae]|nr:hypothetical protein [Herbaspirillum rhizosphaerae]
MRQLRRVLAIFAFVAGGFATEMARPVYCSLLNVASTEPTRRRKRAKV